MSKDSSIASPAKPRFESAKHATGTAAEASFSWRSSASVADLLRLEAVSAGGEGEGGRFFSIEGEEEGEEEEAMDDYMIALRGRERRRQGQGRSYC
jgi:hypothetical protein